LYLHTLLVNDSKAFFLYSSLDNVSDEVRWSVDLRFKKPGADNGMFGLKPDVLMRTKENPNMKIDWDTFDKIDRTKAQIASVKDIIEVQISKQSYSCKRKRNS
jgi:hypothetical protein